MTIAAAMILLAVQPGPSVLGDTSCPTPAEVEARLRPLVASLAPRADEVVRLSERDGSLRVMLESSGEQVASRELPVRRDCGQLAELAAVVVAAWQIDRHPDVGAAPSLVEPRPAAQPRWELALLGGATIGANAGARPGAMLDVAYVPRGRVVSPHLAAWGFAPRDETFGPGGARWTRVGAELGVERRWSFDAGSLSMGPSLVASWLHARGRELPDASSTNGFEPGVAARARFVRWWGSIGAELGAGVVAWVNRQTLFVAPAVDLARTELDLPRVEALVTIGLRTRWGK